MGMDVYGKSPANEQGKYFRASIHTWPNVMVAMAQAGFEVPAGWRHNDGEGLGSQEPCTKLAEMIEQHWFPHGAPVDEQVPVVEGATSAMGDAFGAALSRSGLYMVDPGYVPKVRAGRLWDWCQFLRSCGGFEIW